jgi:hypothetical protein
MPRLQRLIRYCINHIQLLPAEEIVQTVHNAFCVKDLSLPECRLMGAMIATAATNRQCQVVTPSSRRPYLFRLHRR